LKKVQRDRIKKGAGAAALAAGAALAAPAVAGALGGGATVAAPTAATAATGAGTTAATTAATGAGASGLAGAATKATFGDKLLKLLKIGKAGKELIAPVQPTPEQEADLMEGVEEALVNDRIVSVGTAEQSLLLFDTAAAAGQFADSTVDYLRITNLDSTNFVVLRLTHGSDEYFVKIAAGDSFVLFETVMDADSAAGVATATLANIDSIKAQADTAACDVEIFVAA
jgi:hypothetical protein